MISFLILKLVVKIDYKTNRLNFSQIYIFKKLFNKLFILQKFFNLSQIKTINKQLL